MNIETTSTSPPTLAERTAREAAAAQNAIKAEAKEKNTRQIAELSQGASEGHVTEHIRGMVAATMAHLAEVYCLAVLRSGQSNVKHRSIKVRICVVRQPLLCSMIFPTAFCRGTTDDV